jgi:hypothetical protein
VSVVVVEGVGVGVEAGKGDVAAIVDAVVVILDLQRTQES